MERFPNYENREMAIDGLLHQLGKKWEMDPKEEILCDVMAYAPHEGNEDPNEAYIEEVAEKIGVPVEEFTAYAIKKATEGDETPEFVTDHAMYS